MTTRGTPDIDDFARRVRLAARELATEHGLAGIYVPLADQVAGARFYTKPFGPELASLLETYPVAEWVDAYLPEIIQRAGVGGAE